MTGLTRRDAGKLLGAAVAAAAVSGGSRVASAEGGNPDLVFVNGDVITMDPQRPSATAVAVRAGKIIGVGGDAETRALAGPRAEVVDLAGRTLIPGINDSHAHAAVTGLNRPPFALGLGDPAVKSVADIVAAVRQEAGRTPDGQWIRGAGWSPGQLAENRPPNRDDLDPVSPRHPVCLQDRSYNLTAVNSVALELAGIKGGEPGVIVDAGGRPTGLLESAAQGLVQRLLPPWGREQRKQAIQSVIADLHAEGITSFTDPGLGPGGEGLGLGTQGMESLAAYVDLARSGMLAARVSVLFLPCSQSGGSAAEMAKALAEFSPPTGLDPRRFAVRGVKLYADHGGELTVQGKDHAARVAELTEMVRLAHAAGYQAGTHVYRHVDTVVDAYLAAGRTHPRADPRHILIHGAQVKPESLTRIAENRIGLGPQPQSWHNVIDRVAGQFGDSFLPWRSAVDAGVRLLSSSDIPVNPPNWRLGLSVLMTREGLSGKVHDERQRLTLDQALRTYTLTGAWQDFSEAWKGSVTPGKVADLCVLDGDLRNTPTREIPALPVALTVFDGRIVHRRG
nr:amidohydrolase [Kibdelosporangium sp. MJ126-NF4]CEL18006.1 Exoenzymes regulatory protein AepA precursor [Kibdelosporangium sp. MJ126-NF4]CTQ90766.1 Exoenzymes regulatory protein AepA precursor [Kibdelosporangium sp. MJ126-NF4]